MASESYPSRGPEPLERFERDVKETIERAKAKQRFASALRSLQGSWTFDDPRCTAIVAHRRALRRQIAALMGVPERSLPQSVVMLREGAGEWVLADFKTSRDINRIGGADAEG